MPTKIGPVSLSGSVGMSVEGYATNGVASRRDPLSAQVQMSLAAQASRYFSYGLNLALTTQSVNFGQQVGTPLNRGALDLSYRWVSVSGGNIAPSLSKYLMQGTTVRGGMLELTPGPLLFTVVSGRASEAIAPSSALAQIAPAYERWVHAVRLGVGQERSTHFHLIGLYGEDDATSIDAAHAATPAQNVSLATDLQFALFNKALTVSGLGTVSVFTHDTQAKSLNLSLPAWVDDRFAINTSTSVGLAGEVDMALRLPWGQLRTGYERVQPGYESMGLLRPRTDQERIQGQLRLSLLGRRLRVGLRGNQLRNNLLGQLSATRYRRQMAVDGQMQVAQPLAVSVSYSNVQNEVVLSATATRGVPRNLHMQTVTLAPTLTLAQGEVRHTMTVSSTFQWATDRAARAGTAQASAGEQQSAIYTAAYVLGLPSQLAVNVNANYGSVDVGLAETNNLALNVGANQAFLDRKLSVSVTAGYARTRIGRPPLPGGAAERSTVGRLTTNVNARWAVPFGGDLSLSVRGLSTQAEAPLPSYEEVQTSLSYRRRL